MKPTLSDTEYVFCTIAKFQFKKSKLDPIMLFKEREGITLVLEKKSADALSLSYDGIWALITLAVHSDLSAIGFLARITSQLADCGISVNIVSAYYHDHLFVPWEKTAETMLILNELSRQDR